MFKKPPRKKADNLSQFGLLDVPDLDDADEDLDLSDDDFDLEAELAAIGGGSKPHRPRKPAPVPSGDLDAMIAASLRDVPSDDEGSGDDDDPDLLNELQELSIDDEVLPPKTIRPAPPPPMSTDSSTISLLQDRITNYTFAEKTAKDNGDTTRARRFGRGLKTLNDLLKQAKGGKPISNEDIPPPVSVAKPEPQPTPEPQAPAPPPRSTSRLPSAPDLSPSDADGFKRPSTPPEPKDPPPPPPSEAQAMDPLKEQGLQMILRRKEEFKAAALSSKHAGDKALALELMKVVKQFDLVVDAYKAGQDMDLNELPTPDLISNAFRAQQKEESVNTTSRGPDPEPAPAPEPGGLVTAATVDEALRQRLAYFQEQEAKAKEEGNSSKSRRMGRIVKQYQGAIRQHAAGRPLDDDLPTPAGYAPLPGEAGRPASSVPASPSAARAPGTPGPPGAASAPVARPSNQQSRYEKNLVVLLHRQKEFKEAAIKAKKSGNIEQAKEYLRAAKGFDAVIDAARGGLAVDMKSLPLPPSHKKLVDDTFDLISAEDCDPPPGAPGPDDEELLPRLQQQLASQLKLCLTTRDHYRDMGQVAEANRYDHLAVSVKQDLDVIVAARRLGQDPPKFHYESRQFSIVQCNTDLAESVLELTIVRGIAYNVPNPNEVDTYVKFDFAYPQEAPVSDRTALVKDTSSPQYDAVFSLPIQRTSRACQRFFKRHAIKFEVYSRGGWFSKDTLLGAAAVKLAPLETQVALHEAFPLMDGRRAAGGSLEVRLRVRTPLAQPHLEHAAHRWLVLHAG